MINEEIEEISVTNKEIVEYLKITYAVLKETKSTIDLQRLKHVIEILKKDTKKKYSSGNAKSKYKPSIIINICAKLRKREVLSPQELEVREDYAKDKAYFQMVEERRFAELYSYLLNNEKDILTGDLAILYFYLTGYETKVKKKEEVLHGIISYLSQNLYFDNMDERYSGQQSAKFEGNN